MKYLVLTTEEGQPVGIIKNESDTDFSSIKNCSECIEEYEDAEKFEVTKTEGDIFNGIILTALITCLEEQEPTERKYFLQSAPLY